MWLIGFKEWGALEDSHKVQENSELQEGGLWAPGERGTKQARPLWVCLAKNLAPELGPSSGTTVEIGEIQGFRSQELVVG